MKCLFIVLAATIIVAFINCVHHRVGRKTSPVGFILSTMVATVALEAGTQQTEEALDNQMEENVVVLCECVVVEVGFSYGKPIAAYTIYKCLLHWKTLEDERTPVFDKLIHIILSAIEDGDNNNQMAYWISNASTLLFLIHQSIRKRPLLSRPYGRFSMGSRSSDSSGETDEIEDEVQEVEAKYPALLFKKRLIACLNKMYDVIHSNLKKQLGSLLALCIQAPPRSEGMGISRCSFGKDPHINPWQGIVDCLNNLLNTLKENFVPQKIVQKIFTQTFSYINLKIFNSLLLRRESCSLKNGEYVKSGLIELEIWCSQAEDEYTGSSWDELKPVREAIGFLILSLQQLHRMCTLYWDENGNTPRVSHDVISIMRILVTEESSNFSSNSFLIEDRSSMTFSIDDLTTSLQVKDYANVKSSAELSKNPTFQFLYN